MRITLCSISILLLVIYSFLAQTLSYRSKTLTIFRCRNSWIDRFAIANQRCHRNSTFHAEKVCGLAGSQTNKQGCLVRSCTRRRPFVVVGNNGSKCIDLFDSSSSGLSSYEKKTCRKVLWHHIFRKVFNLGTNAYAHCEPEFIASAKLLCDGTWKRIKIIKRFPIRYHKSFLRNFLRRTIQRFRGHLLKIKIRCGRSPKRNFCFLVKSNGTIHCRVNARFTSRPKTKYPISFGNYPVRPGFPPTKITVPTQETFSKNVEVDSGRNNKTNNSTITSDNDNNNNTNNDSDDDNNVNSSNNINNNNNSFIIPLAASCAGVIVAIVIIILFICVARKRVIKTKKSSELRSSATFTSNETNGNSEALRQDDQTQYSQATSLTREVPISDQGTREEGQSPVYEPVLNVHQNLEKSHRSQTASNDITYQSLLHEMEQKNDLYQKLLRPTASGKLPGGRKPRETDDGEKQINYSEAKMKVVSNNSKHPTESEKNNYHSLRKANKDKKSVYQPLQRKARDQEGKHSEQIPKDSNARECSSYVFPAVQHECRLHDTPNDADAPYVVMDQSSNTATRQEGDYQNS